MPLFVYKLKFIIDIVDRWFGSSERNLATAIGSFVNSLGINFGFLFAALLVGSDAVIILNYLELNPQSKFRISLLIKCCIFLLFVIYQRET